MDSLYHQHRWFFWALFLVIGAPFCFGATAFFDRLFSRPGRERLPRGDRLSRSVVEAWTGVCFVAVPDLFRTTHGLAGFGASLLVWIGGVAVWTFLSGLVKHMLHRVRHRSPRPAGSGG